jgi:hypothetical protein
MFTVLYTVLAFLARTALTLAALAAVDGIVKVARQTRPRNAGATIVSAFALTLLAIGRK